MVGWRDTLAVWPPLLVIGGTFAAVQFVWSNFVGFELVDIVSAVASMAAGVVVLRFWKPQDELAVRPRRRRRRTRRRAEPRPTAGRDV